MADPSKPCKEREKTNVDKAFTGSEGSTLFVLSHLFLKLSLLSQFQLILLLIKTFERKNSFGCFPTIHLLVFVTVLHRV